MSILDNLKVFLDSYPHDYVFKKSSRYYDVKAHPEKDVDAFYNMAKFCEKEGIKSFQCSPLRTSFVPGYVQIDMTISCQQAYHNRPVAFVSQSYGNGMYNWVLTCSDPHECRNAGIGTQKRDIARNMPDCVSRDVLISSLTQKDSKAHLMPRQLRGPFENATSQLSKALDPGCSHLSGRNSCGRSNTSSENDTKRWLWLTTDCWWYWARDDHRWA